MFERFTDEARRVVLIAREEAERAGHENVRPAHLLLGIAEAGGAGGEAFRAARVDPADLRRLVLAGGTTLDADALAALGIDLHTVRAAAEETFGAGALDADPPAPRAGRPRFSGGCRRALRSALRGGERRLDSAHVLRGLLAVGDPEVGELLRRLGVSPDELRWHLPRRSAA